MRIKINLLSSKLIILNNYDAFSQHQYFIFLYFICLTVKHKSFFFFALVSLFWCCHFRKNSTSISIINVLYQCWHSNPEQNTFKMFSFVFYLSYLLNQLFNKRFLQNVLPLIASHASKSKGKGLTSHLANNSPLLIHYF